MRPMPCVGALVSALSRLICRSCTAPRPGTEQAGEFPTGGGATWSTLCPSPGQSPVAEVSRLTACTEAEAPTNPPFDRNSCHFRQTQARRRRSRVDAEVNCSPAWVVAGAPPVTAVKAVAGNTPYPATPTAGPAYRAGDLGFVVAKGEMVAGNRDHPGLASPAAIIRPAPIIVCFIGSMDKTRLLRC